MIRFWRLWDQILHRTFPGVWRDHVNKTGAAAIPPCRELEPSVAEAEPEMWLATRGRRDGQQHGTLGGQVSWTWKALVPQSRAPSFRISWAKDVLGQLNFAG